MKKVNKYLIIFDNVQLEFSNCHFFCLRRGHEHVLLVVHLAAHGQDLFLQKLLLTLELTGKAGQRISILDQENYQNLIRNEITLSKYWQVPQVAVTGRKKLMTHPFFNFEFAFWYS